MDRFAGNEIAPGAADLSTTQYDKIRDMVYRICGIRIRDGKEAMVRSRLMKRLRALGIDKVDDYLDLIGSEAGAGELGLMIDVMTTNKTSFFREPDHFDFMRDQVFPELRNHRIRCWSAACSSGEEAFSLAMLLRDCVADIDSRDCLILATDISTRVLQQARTAIYREDKLSDLPAAFRKQYFTRVNDGSGPYLQIRENVRNMVRFAWLNLMEPWPMKGPFNIILCRNAMIYFDKLTQQKLIERFWSLLEPGGYFFVGHAEGLSAISHKFQHVRAATYRK